MIYADVVLKDGRVLSSTGDFVEDMVIHGETISLLGRSDIVDYSLSVSS